MRGDIDARCEVIEEGADKAGATFRVRAEQHDLRDLQERLAKLADG